MGAITGVVTTFNAPNYVGSLFHVTPFDTPFFSMIGGLNGVGIADDVYVTWQTDDNAAAAQSGALEGADPTYTARSRSEVGNVSQIFQYGTDVTYTKKGATGMLGTPSGTATAHLGVQPVQSELARQQVLLDRRFRRDANYSFINGAFARPADNLSARTTRGILAAITTHSSANGGTPRALTKALVDGILADLRDDGAPMVEPVLFVGSVETHLLVGPAEPGPNAIHYALDTASAAVTGTVLPVLVGGVAGYLGAR